MGRATGLNAEQQLALRRANTTPANFMVREVWWRRCINVKVRQSRKSDRPSHRECSEKSFSLRPVRSHRDTDAPKTRESRGKSKASVVEKGPRTHTDGCLFVRRMNPVRLSASLVSLSVSAGRRESRFTKQASSLRYIWYLPMYLLCRTALELMSKEESSSTTGEVTVRMQLVVTHHDKQNLKHGRRLLLSM